MDTLNYEHLEPDFGTAAFLHVCCFHLLGLSPIRPGRYAFRFSDPEAKHRKLLWPTWPVNRWRLVPWYKLKRV